MAFNTCRTQLAGIFGIASCRIILATPGPLASISTSRCLLPFSLAGQTEVVVVGQILGMPLVEPLTEGQRIIPANLHNRMSIELGDLATRSQRMPPVRRLTFFPLASANVPHPAPPFALGSRFKGCRTRKFFKLRVADRKSANPIVVRDIQSVLGLFVIPSQLVVILAAHDKLSLGNRYYICL